MRPLLHCRGELALHGMHLFDRDSGADRLVPRNCCWERLLFMAV